MNLERGARRAKLEAGRKLLEVYPLPAPVKVVLVALLDEVEELGQRVTTVEEIQQVERGE